MSNKNIKTIADVMDSDFLKVDGIITVTEALQRMRAADIDFLLVDKRNDHDEYGIVLVSDIAKRVLAPNHSPDRVNVYEIMTKPVLTVQPDMNIRYCARLFERFGISTAPVVRGGEVLGVVTYTRLVLNGLAAG